MGTSVKLPPVTDATSTTDEKHIPDSIGEPVSIADTKPTTVANSEPVPITRAKPTSIKNAKSISFTDAKFAKTALRIPCNSSQADNFRCARRAEEFQFAAQGGSSSSGGHSNCT